MLSYDSVHELHQHGVSEVLHVQYTIFKMFMIMGSTRQAEVPVCS